MRMNDSPCLSRWMKLLLAEETVCTGWVGYNDLTPSSRIIVVSSSRLSFHNGVYC